jgi:hypothetical protein
MEFVKMCLKCNLCGSQDGIVHTMTPLNRQEFLFDGKHIHLCKFCVAEYYGHILTEVDEADTKVLKKLMGEKEYNFKYEEYLTHCVRKE